MKVVLRSLVLIALVSSTPIHAMTEVPEDRGPRHQPARDEYITNSYSDTKIPEDPRFIAQRRKLQIEFEMAPILAVIERLMLGFQSYLRLYLDFIKNEDPSKVFDYYRKNAKICNLADTVGLKTADQIKVFVETKLRGIYEEELKDIWVALRLLNEDSLDGLIKVDSFYYRFATSRKEDLPYRVMGPEILEFLKPHRSIAYDKFQDLLNKVKVELRRVRGDPQLQQFNETNLVIFLKKRFHQLPDEVMELKALKGKLGSQSPEVEQLVRNLEEEYNWLFSDKRHGTSRPDKGLSTDYFNVVFRRWFGLFDRLSEGIKIVTKRMKALQVQEKQRAEASRISQVPRQAGLTVSTSSRADEKHPAGQTERQALQQKEESEKDELEFSQALQEHNLRVLEFREKQVTKTKEYKRGVEAGRIERRVGARSAEADHDPETNPADSKNGLTANTGNPLSEAEKKALRSLWSLASGGAKDLFIRIFRERERGFGVDQIDTLVSSMGKFDRKRKSSHFKIQLPNTYVYEGVDDSAIGFLNDEEESENFQSPSFTAGSVKGGTSRLHGGSHTENRISNRNFSLLLDVYERAGITVERLKLAGIDI